jgi:predicted ABC-type ATPase
MPELFIIAGPNGAGKSTYSESLVRPYMGVFDGDKELRTLTSKYPDVDSAHLENVRNDMFQAQKETALKNRVDFAYETNFASEQTMETVQQFKDRGFSVNLIYVGLANIQNAISRVNLRVSQGGHRVPGDQIRENYEDGLKNLQKYARVFDRTLIYDNSSNKVMTPPKLLFELKKGLLIEKAAKIPKWAELLSNELSVGHSHEQKQARGRKR